MRPFVPIILVLVCSIFDPTSELPNHVANLHEETSIHRTNPRLTLHHKEYVKTSIEHDANDRDKIQVYEDTDKHRTNPRLTLHHKEYVKTSIEHDANDRDKIQVYEDTDKHRTNLKLPLHHTEHVQTSIERDVKDRDQRQLYEESEMHRNNSRITLHYKEHVKTSIKHDVPLNDRGKRHLYEESDKLRTNPSLTLQHKKQVKTSKRDVNDTDKRQMYEEPDVHWTSPRLTLHHTEHVKTIIERDVNDRDKRELYKESEIYRTNLSITSLYHKEHVKTNTRNVNARVKREVDPCASFQLKGSNILSSPKDHPDDTTYSRNTTCITKITARDDDIVKLTFFHKFKIEDSPNCENDYLEIRDGEFGYSHPVRKYCGDIAPEPFTSTGPYLWLKFHSDDTIEHHGFQAKVEFETNNNNGQPSRKIPLSCRKEVEGQVYGEIGSHSDDVTECRHESPKELDIQWKIVTPANTSVFLNFTDYKLALPNDCESNFVQIFGAEPNFDHKLGEYCGSVAKPVTTKLPKEGFGPSNIMYVRMYADKLARDTKFSAQFTAFRTLTGQDTCMPVEFDCGDGTCIDGGLACNDIPNCRLKQDEECAGEKKSLLKETRILVMLIIFLIGLSAVSVFFLFTCIRKVYRDHQYIKETLQAKSQEHLEQMCDDQFSFDSDGMDRLSVPSDSPERENLANTTRHMNERKSGSMESDLLQLDSPLDGDNDWPESTPILTDEIETKHQNRPRRSDASKSHFRRGVESPKIKIEKEEDRKDTKYKNKPRRSDASNRKESLRTEVTKEDKSKRIENKELKRRESNKKEKSPETKRPKEKSKDTEKTDRSDNHKTKNEFSRANTFKEEEPKEIEHKSRPRRDVSKKEESQKNVSKEELTEIEVKGSARRNVNKKQLLTPKTSQEEEFKEIENKGSPIQMDANKKEESLRAKNTKETIKTGNKSRLHDTSKKEESLRTKSLEDTKESKDASVGTLHTMEFGCQTRESLFLTDPVTSSDGTTSSSNGLSGFACSSGTIIRPYSPVNISHITIDLPAPAQEPTTHADRRPMSSETTRSAPDVIIVAKPLRLS